MKLSVPAKIKSLVQSRALLFEADENVSLTTCFGTLLVVCLAFVSPQPARQAILLASDL